MRGFLLFLLDPVDYFSPDHFPIHRRNGEKAAQPKEEIRGDQADGHAHPKAGWNQWDEENACDAHDDIDNRSTQRADEMDIAGNLALVSMIDVDIAGGSDEQFVHGTVDQFAANDMTKSMNRSDQLHGNDKVNGLKQSLFKSEACAQEVKKEMQSEKDEGTKPRQRRDEKGHIPELPNANPSDGI